MAAATASAKTLALRTGLHPDTVRSACARALVEPNAAGRYPVEAAERACRENIDRAKVDGKALAGWGNRTAAQVVGLEPVDPLEGLEGAFLTVPAAPAGVEAASTFATAARYNRDSARLKVEKQQLDLDERRGRLVSRESVERVAADLARRAAFHFLELAERATPRVLGKTDPSEVAAILEEEARRSLAELSSLDQLADEVLGLR